MKHYSKGEDQRSTRFKTGVVKQKRFYSIFTICLTSKNTQTENFNCITKNLSGMTTYIVLSKE